MGYLPLNRKELRRHYEADRTDCLAQFESIVNAGEMRLGHQGVKLHDVFEALTDMQVEDLYRIKKNQMESADFVGLSDFTVAAGLFLLGESNMGYKRPLFMADTLCMPREAASLKLSQKLPYYPVPASDNAYDKLEGEAYNTIGAPYGYIETTPPKDRGFIINVTREVLRDDKTGGGIAQNCYRQGEGLGIARELDFLKSILGVQDSWKFGKQDAYPTTSYSTYATSGAPYVNSLANPLTSWKSVDAALQLFAQMTDPVTGQIIGIPSTMMIVVPFALMMRAKNFLNATDVQEVDNQAASATVRSTFNNPLTNMPVDVTFTLKSNQWVKQATSSDSTWYIGDFPQAFIRNDGWQEEQMEQGQEGNLYFENNILYRQRFSYNQRVFPYAPFRCVKNT